MICIKSAYLKVLKIRVSRDTRPKVYIYFFLSLCGVDFALSNVRIKVAAATATGRP